MSQFRLEAALENAAVQYPRDDGGGDGGDDEKEEPEAKKAKTTKKKKKEAATPAPGVQDGLVHVRIQQRNEGKTLTTIQGLSVEYDLKKIVRTCKKVWLWRTA